MTQRGHDLNKGNEANAPLKVLPEAAVEDRRVASVDALRGLTILLMIFVNDLGRAAPSWLHHIQPPNGDGMTVADLVFPSFLFIVGVSIPLAFERALEAGRSKGRQLLHILTRSGGLLIMGLVELNSDSDRTLGEPLWGLLAFICVILAWSVVPRGPGRGRKWAIGIKSLGVLGLLALLTIYRRKSGSTDIAFLGHVENWVWLRTEWWGILGLIGWSYLTVAVLTLMIGRRREWLSGAIGLLMCVHLAFHHGGLFSRVDQKAWLGGSADAIKVLAKGTDRLAEFVGLGDATGSLAAITMAGCLLGSILRRDSEVRTHRDRLVWTLTFIMGLLLAGFVTDTFEGINKIGATPTWCFWSAALACSVWSLLYLLMDVGRFRAWSYVVRPAGENPLLAYFLHPITTSLVGLSGFGGLVLGYKDSSDPRMVVAGSMAMALFICVVTGLVGRVGLRTRL